MAVAFPIDKALDLAALECVFSKNRVESVRVRLGFFCLSSLPLFLTPYLCHAIVFIICPSKLNYANFSVVFLDCFF